MTLTSELIREICCNCSIEFAMPESLRNERLSDGKSFYCPNGHPQHFTESDISKLQRQLQTALSSKKFYEERSDRYRVEMIKQERRGNGLKSALTLTKRRIAKGKCPCCDRTFEDLKQHIADKHKQYKGKMS